MLRVYQFKSPDKFNKMKDELKQVIIIALQIHQCFHYAHLIYLAHKKISFCNSIPLVFK